jgi:hypothetical protein
MTIAIKRAIIRENGNERNLNLYQPLVSATGAGANSSLVMSW